MLTRAHLQIDCKKIIIQLVKAAMITLVSDVRDNRLIYRQQKLQQSKISRCQRVKHVSATVRGGGNDPLVAKQLYVTLQNLEAHTPFGKIIFSPSTK